MVTDLLSFNVGDFEKRRDTASKIGDRPRSFAGFYPVVRLCEENQVPMKRWLYGPAVLVALLGGVACAPPPKVVRQITSAREQIKFLVVQGRSQQVVKCKMAGDGALSECKTMQIVLKGEEE